MRRGWRWRPGATRTVNLPVAAGVCADDTPRRLRRRPTTLGGCLTCTTRLVAQPSSSAAQRIALAPRCEQRQPRERRLVHHHHLGTQCHIARGSTAARAHRRAARTADRAEPATSFLIAPRCWRRRCAAMRLYRWTQGYGCRNGRGATVSRYRRRSRAQPHPRYNVDATPPSAVSKFAALEVTTRPDWLRRRSSYGDEVKSPVPPTSGVAFLAPAAPIAEHVDATPSKPSRLRSTFSPSLFDRSPPSAPGPRLTLPEEEEQEDVRALRRRHPAIILPGGGRCRLGRAICSGHAAG